MNDRKEATNSQTKMLHEFLTANHDELITRCKGKVARRRPSAAPPMPDDRGIATFLGQLVDTLRREAASSKRHTADARAQGSAEISRAAALHGAELLRHGFTVDQVVHDYGDVCQAVTELAIERNVPMSTDEFRTLNRCLDNAIADAVTAFALGCERTRDSHADMLQQRMDAFSAEHGRLIDIATHSFSAIKTGSIGAAGATGALLMHALDELRSLAEQMVRPDVSGQEASPSAPRPHKARTRSTERLARPAPATHRDAVSREVSSFGAHPAGAKGREIAP